jgi:hypothetical protein
LFMIIKHIHAALGNLFMHVNCRMFGPCVETVMVENVAPGQQPVYGRVVLCSAVMIPVVLEGQDTAKFMIKGRHLWARMYIPNSRVSHA